MIFGLVTNAQALKINVGGGDPLNLSSFKITSQENFDGTTNKKEGILGTIDIGTSKGSPWFGEISQGAYNLINNSEPNAVRYYFIGNVPEGDPKKSLSEGAVSADVKIASDSRNSGAGLIYRYSPATKNYYAFILFQGGGHSILYRSAEGFKQILSGASKALKPEASNTLAIVPQETKMEFYINDHQVAKVDDGNKPKGHVGIITAGTGTFSFDNFTTHDSEATETTAVIPPKKEAPVVPDANTKKPTLEKKTAQLVVSGKIPPPNPLTTKDPYIGTFANEQLRITLDGDNPNYSGQIKFGDQLFPVFAKKVVDGIKGTFESNGHKYDFVATLKDNTLTFFTGGTKYLLIRLT